LGDHEYIAAKEQIPADHRFGSKQALFPSCRSLINVLDGNTFIKDYDIVLVAHVFCISSKHCKVLKAIKKIRDRRWCL
jgi:hypothetical protein